MNDLKFNAARILFKSAYEQYGLISAINITANTYGLTSDQVIDKFVDITIKDAR